LKTTNIQHPSAGSPNLVLAADGGVTGGGLDLITTEAFSVAVSSVSVNGCFTSDYTNYSIVIEQTNGSTGTSSFRYRASGSDASTSNYNRQSLWGDGSSASAVNPALESQGYYTVNGHTGLAFVKIDIHGPNLAAPTMSISSGRTLHPSVEITGTYHNLSTAYDGITIFPNVGTFTGTMRIYGYKD